MPYSELADRETHKRILRRQQPRYSLRSLVYVKLGEGNGGVVRDLTTEGIAVHSVTPLQPNQQLRVSFDLLSPRVHVDAAAIVVWSDPNGQAGIHFSALTLRTQRALRDWLFMQILSASVITGRDSVFSAADSSLTLSAGTRVPILVGPLDDELEAPQISLGLFSFSTRGFSIFVDALVLVCALLVFSVSSVAVMGGLPAWPLTLALFFTSSVIFVAVYQLLFSDFFCGATPGKRLARIALFRSEPEEQMARFR